MQRKKLFGRYRDFYFLLTVICLTFIFLYRNLPLEYMWAFSDLPAFNRIRGTYLFISSWDSQFLGFHYETSVSRALLFVLEFFIENDIIVQKIYFLSILPLSFITMSVFMRNFSRSIWSKILPSFLYAINPVTIGEFVNGSVWMIAYACFPLMFYLLLRIYESQKNIVTYGLSLSILIGLLIVPPWTLFWTFLPIPFIVFSKLLCISGKTELKLFFKRSIFILVFVLIGFTLLLSTIYYVVFVSESAFQPQSIVSYFEDVNYCYSKATPLNVIRLAGNAGSPMDTLGYNDIVWWTIPGMIIPLIAFVPLLNAKKERCFFDLALSLMVILVAFFMYLTRIRVTYSLFSELPFLFSLRNPKQLTYFLAFGLSFLFGRGLDTLFNLTKKLLNRKQNLAFFFLTIAVTSSLLIYAFPAWEGDMSLGKVRGDSYIVPQTYYEIADILKKNDNTNEFYRVLWLPYTYQTQIRIVNMIQHFGAKLGQNVVSTPSVEFVEDLFRRIEYNNYENFSQIVALFNIKYVVIDKTQSSDEPIKVYKQSGTPFIKGDPELFDSFINEQNGFFKISESNEFSIYQNSFYLPYLSVLKLVELKKETEDYNLVLNGNFSENTKYWRIWIYSEDSILIIDNETISPSLLLLKSPKNTGNSVLTQKISNVTPGFQYKFFAWMKTENSRGSLVKVAWFDRDYNLIEKDALRHDVLRTVVREEKPWLQFEDVFRAPKNATTAVVYLVAGPSVDGSSPGKTWFANIEMKKLKSPIEQLFTYHDKEQILSFLFKNPSENFNSISQYDRDKSTIIFRINNTEPSFITMAESYDTEWVAYANEQELPHLGAIGWANGFFIPTTGEYEVKILFQAQNTRDLMINIWLIAWGVTVVAWIGLIFRRIWFRSKNP